MCVHSLLADWAKSLVGVTGKHQLLASPVDGGNGGRVGHTQTSNEFCVVSPNHSEKLTLGQHFQASNTAFTPRIPLSIVFALDTPPSPRVHGGNFTVVAPDSSLLDCDILEWFQLSNLVRFCLR